ncbi:MAG TPA: ABC transporter substrate-binding protein [Terriglobales bacterium]|nr:ABC transporter substrate-binding protein [Terriglobales bacterium]
MTVPLLLISMASAAEPRQDLLKVSVPAGHPGGVLVVSQSSEPKTLNPIVAVDQPSRDVIRRIMADLVHINRATQRTEPALAKSWEANREGSQFTVELRRGLRFSDGVPFDADDVVFSFRVYLDEQVHSPQRDLLIAGGKPMKVEKLGPYTVKFSFAAPYAPAERVFDSVAILPRHLLEDDYKAGRINQVWNLTTSPEKIAGLGPFRLKQVVPGEKLVLEKNPYYWKTDSQGQSLPYLNELIFLTVPNRDAQVVRFRAGETQVITQVSAENFSALQADQQAGQYKLYDAGPGLEYNFLVFNLNDDVKGRLPLVERKQKWFRDQRFRQAVSLAIDRAALVRLVYQGRGVALGTPVSPGDKLWFDSRIPVPERSPDRAKKMLQAAGFTWNSNGSLVDSAGQAVEFSILVNSGNVQRSQMATLIQDDLKKIGMNVHVAGLEFRSATDRVLNAHDYDVSLMGLGRGDTDPTPDMGVWLSNGEIHLWNMGEKTPATPWEAEIDRLMRKQLVTPNYPERKKLYDRVQSILAEQQPMIFLASPHILAAARDGLENVRPAIMENYILWNADELFWHTPAGKH